jgi:topoisomerase-4 subunit B
VATASLDKITQNQEVNHLIQAIGCGTGKQCDSRKLRYHRIIIMTDADVDGAHIASLLLTFFFQEMRSILEDGHIFLAQPPLYRLSYKGKTVYARDDKEKDHLLKTTFARAQHIEISRFKGLGEMPVEQLRATTMAPDKRTLLRVILDKTPEAETSDEFVSRLMGKNPEARFRFIQENAQYSKDIDV